ncbi:lactonase family protein [Achromobacter sp. 2789STDY5608621]|uniref:lactonase family protein n=1 Tax=Achromobacter sp. 2789STDY5608621 TaxID=1806496 RepID=UPI0006C2B570|nr:lactonase family protein [Achromobacter sp. 2789STDY5608621]CUI27805.1 6-phosphogluconolactonase [Achromobacter sp. 2789STDY5608621]
MRNDTPSPAPGDCVLAVGTYTQAMPHVQGRGLGIHLLAFEAATASFRSLQVVSGPINPSYLCAAAGRLYSVSEQERDATLDIYAIEAGATVLRPIGQIATPGAAPCHVSVNLVARQLYVSNYGSGELLCYALDAEGLPRGAPQVIARRGAGPRADRQEGPHVHYAAPSGDGARVYLCDLGTDTIACYRVLPDGLDPAPARELRTRPGAGPRHLALTADGAHAAVVEELSNTVAIHALDEPAGELARASTLPRGWRGANTASAVRLHPDGEWLYAANRGHDSVAVYRLHRVAPWLDLVGFIDIGGRAPRDIALTPDGAFLLAASQDDHFIRALRIDPSTGLAQAQGDPHLLASPACLCPLP